jgi:signal transduction histidine kinase
LNSHPSKTFFWLMRFAFLALLALPVTLVAQRSSNWRVYRASDGLQDSVCTGLSISARGGIWVHHPNRSHLSWLDGYDVRKLSLPGLAAAHIYEGRVGQIWAPITGGVAEFKDGSWIRYPIGLLAGQNDTVLLPLRQGQVLALAPERLISFSSDPSPEALSVREAAVTKLGTFTDLLRSRDGGAWIGGKFGLGKFNSLRPLDSTMPLEEHLATGLDVEDFVALTEDDEGGITCVAHSTRDGKKKACHWDGTNWTVLPTSTMDLAQAWRSHDGSFWELGPYGLVHLRQQGNRWRAEDELLAAQYYEAATDTNGVFWVATSEGLYRYAPPVWQPDGAPEMSGAVTIVTGNQFQLWCASAFALHAFDGARWRSFPFPDDLKKSPLVNEVLVRLSNQMLLLGGSNQLFTFNPRTETFAAVQHPTNQRLKCLGALKEGAVCFEIGSPTAKESFRLESFDGQQFKPLANVPKDIDVGSELQFVYLSQIGTLWIAGDRGVAYLTEGKWQKLEQSGSTPENIVAILEVEPNKLWVATRERLVQFNGKDWTVIQGGFERINGMCKARDGSVWVASNNGVHRFYRGAWLANGTEEGLSSLVVRQIVEDAQGRIWAATARGLNLYHSDADLDPPEAIIQAVAPESISTDGALTLDFRGYDRWKQTASDRLLFSYRIDEQDWSPMQIDRSIHFNQLKSGKHFFQVRAMDRNWNVDTKPALLEFVVPVPWFRDTQLLLIGGAASIAVLFFAGLAFNRHRQLVHSYAQVEKIVEQRTRELERANRELFQSQKMNALGTLAAGIAHDFNSILSIIKGSAQIIEGSMDNEEKVRTRVDRIKTAVDQGAGIVKAMLGFSRSSDHEVAQCQINPVVEETIRLLGDRFQRDAEVTFEAAADLPTVCIVKDFVQQIILNFILNAAEAMPPSGKIIVRTGMLEQWPGELVLTPESAPKYVYVAVQDFGCGISAEILSRIFEPFFTTKAFSTKRGTGLGLSMVYELSKELKCGLSVRSNAGEGSTFTLIIPVV